ncbi:MAG: hypothetical protein Q4D76_19570, partial [Oscillospiraceae bacterium]|nr:hypothetical protein [Oscillospiraceae bacterium]
YKLYPSKFNVRKLLNYIEDLDEKYLTLQISNLIRDIRETLNFVHSNDIELSNKLSVKILSLRTKEKAILDDGKERILDLEEYVQKLNSKEQYFVELFQQISQLKTFLEHNKLSEVINTQVYH